MTGIEEQRSLLNCHSSRDKEALLHITGNLFLFFLAYHFLCLAFQTAANL